MKKVITYGTYDLLHQGHIKLLERAKKLGDYLIVGVTADDFDKRRGKVNVTQSLIERIENIRATGLADEIIIEEYEGQKIDDIKRLNIDIFTVGSDWRGKFDYLNEYCEVIYLDRTPGISSSKIRENVYKIKIGLVGEGNLIGKYYKESFYINGIKVVGVCSKENLKLKEEFENIQMFNYEKLLEEVDAVYIVSFPERHYEQIKKALEKRKHVLCEAPITLKIDEFEELTRLAKKNECILMTGLKVAYSTAYNRLLLLIKSGKIGKVRAIDITCTSLKKIDDLEKSWNSICSWGGIAMLPVFQILGIDYLKKDIISLFRDEKNFFDNFSRIEFLYNSAVATIKVGNGVKSEGELIISGEKGYIFVPAPWWKMDYFEIRYEEQEKNERYFYQLEGEGIRYQLLIFIKSIKMKKNLSYIDNFISREIIRVIENYYERDYFPLEGGKY